MFGVIVNRVPVKVMPEVARSLASQDAKWPVYVLPEQPELAYPTVAEVVSALNARPITDAKDLRKASWAGVSLAPSTRDELLQRDVRAVTVGAMSVEHFIDDLVDGTLVIVPGDRPDILVASIISTLSSAFPAVAGVVLTAGYELHPAVRRLLETAPFPVLEVPQRTYAAATAVESVRPAHDGWTTQRKIAAALGVLRVAVWTLDELERADRRSSAPRA